MNSGDDINRDHVSRPRVLQIRLMVLVVLSMTPIFGLILYNGYEQRQADSEAVRLSAEELLRNVRHNHEQLIDNAHHLLLAMAQLPPVLRQDVAHCKKVFNNLLGQFATYIQFTAFTPDGSLFCSAPDRGAHFSIADRAHYRRARETKSFTMSDYVVSRLLGTPAVFLIQPVIAGDDELNGFVSAGLNMAWLDQLVDETALPAGATLTVFDRNGVVLARYPDDGVGMGESVPEQELAVMLHRGAQFTMTDLIDARGERFFYAYAPVSGHDVNAYISVTIPRGVAMADANASLMRNLGSLLIVTVLTLLAAWVGGYVFVVRQVNVLVDVTRRLRRGELGVRSGAAESAGGELGELARAFDDMAAALQSRERARQRVEHALRSLAKGVQDRDSQTILAAIVKELAVALDVRCCFLGLYYADTPHQVETIKVYMDGAPAGNFIYPLVPSPCGGSLQNKSICVSASQARDEFPQDTVLAKLNAESFAATTLIGFDGEPVGLLAIVDDRPNTGLEVTHSLLHVFGARAAAELERHEMERQRQALVDELQLAATAFESNEGMFIADKQWSALRVNKAFTEITGYPLDAIIGQSAAILFASDPLPWQGLDECGHWRGETVLRHYQGHTIMAALSISTVSTKDGVADHYVVHFQDIGERKQAEARIKFLAYHDPLTGLPNRALLLDRLRQAIATAQRHDVYGAVMFLDLDNFKDINDTLGHAVGDDLLKQVAQRLIKLLREEDTVARLGGDEFVVVAPQLSAHGDHLIKEAQALAEKVHDTLMGTYQAAEHVLEIGVSVGVAVFPDHGLSADEVLRHADLAMYDAKTAGRNEIRFFEPDMQTHVQQRLSLEKALRDAVAGDGFILHYQPKIDASTKRIVGCEALLRWKHPRYGLLSPDKLISTLEDSGLIRSVGFWVFEQACRTGARVARQAENLRGALTVAVNVSPRQFNDIDFVERVRTICHTCGLSPQLLEIEITESTAMKDAEETITKVNALKALGVRFTIDDFGTGHSSLSHIKKLPIDTLKIDRGFIHDCVNDASDRAIIQAIVSLARSLGLDVVAEGVETPEQFSLLREMGCTLCQGYLFYPPLTEVEYESCVAGGAAAGEQIDGD